MVTPPNPDGSHHDASLQTRSQSNNLAGVEHLFTSRKLAIAFRVVLSSYAGQTVPCTLG
jgi:hypothetical protein